MLPLFGATKVTETESREPLPFDHHMNLPTCHALARPPHSTPPNFLDFLTGCRWRSASHPFSFWKKKDKSSLIGIVHNLKAGMICITTGTERERNGLVELTPHTWLMSETIHTFI
jgi:hypothetical protein